MRRRAQPAADDDLEAPLDAALHLARAGDEADVVHGHQPEVVVAGREGGLELARQQLADVQPQAVGRDSLGVGRDVEGLVGADAGEVVGGDVAHRVAAGLAGREPHRAEQPHHRGRLVERHEVHLQVLARGQVPHPPRRVAVDDVGQHVHLRGVEPAVGDLDADHVHVGLALAVDAVLQAEEAELQRVDLVALEAPHVRLVVLDLGLDLIGQIEVGGRVELSGSHDISPGRSGRTLTIAEPPGTSLSQTPKLYNPDQNYQDSA